MAHRRSRYIEIRLKKAMSFSPIVGVVGHRQVGKTTLLEETTSHYFTLDDPDNLEEALTHPKAFLQNLPNTKTAIDECQLAPPLFPVLKDHVRKNQRPGQYLLSGSVRFTSKKSIQESLTGRIVNLELLPFSITELIEEPLSRVMVDFTLGRSAEDFCSEMRIDKKRSTKIEKHLETYFTNGGLPGICFIRDEKLKRERLETQLQTLLDRDLKTIVNTRLTYPEIRRICVEIAKKQGEPIQFEKIRTSTKIAPRTLKSILYGLESIFILRKIPIYGSKGRETYIFEDIAESNHLLGKTERNWTQFLFCNLRTQFEYLIGEPYQVFQYRTRSNVVIPLAFSFQNHHCGIIPTKAAVPDRVEMGAARSFLQAFDQSKVLMIHTEAILSAPHPRILVAPLSAVI